MNLIEFFVRNPVKVAVALILLMLFGGIAMVRMPMQLTPDVEQPTLTISTLWPGASPQEIERELIEPQEAQLKAVEGVVKMSSTSSSSSGQITLEFAVGTDMSEALLKVNARLQQVASYPVDARQPVISSANASNRPIAWFILSQRVPPRDQIDAFIALHPQLAGPLRRARDSRSSGLALRRLRLLADDHPEVGALLPPALDVTELRTFAEDVIEARFERVPGVANSNVIGGREEEVQVIVDPERLAARGLTIANLRTALRAANKDTSGGDFWEGKRRYVVRTRGQLGSLAQVEQIVLAQQDGAATYLRDVADVRMGFKKADGLVRNLGNDAIAINAERAGGANVIEVMAGLKQARDELDSGPLTHRQLQLAQVYDETLYIEASVSNVGHNIIIGSLLTIAVLLLYLRSGASTLVISLAIPSSVVGTFLMLYLLGRSLNVISLAGMAFAVGMLVDNAIVVLENIYRHYQQGASRVQAAMRGTGEVWGAVTASTLTTLAVFLPVLFIKEEAGQLFADIALAISCAVGLSMLISVTLIPTATARALAARGTPRPRGPLRRALATAALPLRGLAWLLGRLTRPLDWIGGGVAAAILGYNRWLQRGVLRRLAVVAGLSGLAIYLSVLWIPKVEYLPTGNRNLVFGILLPPPGYNLDQISSMGKTIEHALRPYWDVDPGSPEAARLDGPIIGDYFYVARGRNLFLGLKAHDETRAAELEPLIFRAIGQLPGTFGIAKQASLFERGLSAGRTIEIEIVGPQLETLVGLGGRIMGMVNTSKALKGSRAIPQPSLDLSSPEVHVTPRLEQAAELGVNASDLGYTVDALVDGAYASDFFRGGTKIDLTILGQARFASRMQDLAAMTVVTPTGQLVPLSAVARIELGSGPEQINHSERQRTITIQVSPPRTIALEQAMQAIDAEIVRPLRASGALQGGYSIRLAGTADKLNATWAALSANLLLALLITYLLMAALFESWTYPLVIIFSVPLGAVGGLGALKLLNVWVAQPLDVLTMLGFVILIGTVVNNAILIVHQSLNNIRDAGMPSREAILDSVRTRIRPIFMTTTTTVFGLAPLVLIPGAGSELYRGLGCVVLGGLMVSSLFTLLLIPALFSLAMDLKGLLGGVALDDLPAAEPEVVVAEGAEASEPVAEPEVETLDAPADITRTRDAEAPVAR